MSGRTEGDGRRALIGLVTAAVLLVQLAPMATGLLAGLLHGAFHLSSRTGLEHLQAHAEPPFDPSSAPEATSPPVRSGEAGSGQEHSHGSSAHTHGPNVPAAVLAADRAGHAHAPARGQNSASSRDESPSRTASSRSPHASARAVHAHGPDGEAHAHSPTVDRVLRMASSPEQPIMAPTPGSDRGSDRYLRPASTDFPAPPGLTATHPPVRTAAPSLPHPIPPVPPPRSSSILHT